MRLGKVRLGKLRHGLVRSGMDFRVWFGKASWG